MSERFWEVDSFRGLAILMMAFYHLIFDLNYLGGFDINPGPLRGRYIFLFLVGVSLTLSFSVAKKRVPSDKLFKKYLKRGTKIFLWGMVITLITWIFLRDAYVLFGVLHLIGVSIILAYPFIDRKYLSLVLGSLVIVVGVILYKYSFDFSYLMWLGFAPKGLNTVDYFPLLPWFGLILVGIFVGKTLYHEGGRKFRFFDLSDNIFVKFTSFLGRHSLFIYLVHQPLIIGMLALIGFIPFNTLI